jgi:hypothetical protein
VVVHIPWLSPDFACVVGTDLVLGQVSSMPPGELRPAELPDLSSAVRLGPAGRFGLSRHRLRGAGWERLSHGLPVPVDPDRSLAERAELIAAVLPRDSGFGHLTSAALRGWWLPNRVTTRLLLATTTSAVHVQRDGVYVRRSRYAEFEQVGGIRCVTAASTLLELARDLSLVDLVPMVAAALASGTSPDAILWAARRRSRGVVALRAAVELGDARSESWWESVLRLQHVLTGLGPVECQAEVTDGHGFPIARADLWLVGTTRLPECDGDAHRTPAGHATDLRRDRDLTGAGWARYGYSPQEIASRPDRIIRDAEQARGLPHDPERLRAWWHLAEASTLTGHGRARLASRLRRYRLAAVKVPVGSRRPSAA